MAQFISIFLLIVITFSASVSMAQANELKTQEMRQHKPEQMDSLGGPLLSRSTILELIDEPKPILSPSGKSVAFIKHNNKLNVQELWVKVLPNSKPYKVLTSSEINKLQWARSDEYLIFQNENKVSVVDNKPNSYPQFVATLNSRHEAKWIGLSNTYNVGVLVHKKNMRTNQYELYKYTLNTPAQRLFSSDFQVDDVLLHSTNENVNPIQFIKLYKDKQLEIYQVVNDVNQFPIGMEQLGLIATCVIGDPCNLVGIGSKNQSLYVNARLNGDKARLHKITLIDKQITPVFSESLLNKTTNQTHSFFSSDKFDLAGVINQQNETSSIETGFAQVFDPELLVINDLLRTYIPLTPQAKNKLERAHEVFKNKDKILNIQASIDGQFWLVNDESANRSNRDYVWIDHNTNQRHTLVLSETQDLTTLRNQTYTQVVEYQVSDKMWQFGYLTLPSRVVVSNSTDSKISRPEQNFELDSPFPLVVFPHGGPWSRDYGRWDPLVAFIASRGYAVWQPNFRASIGMGHRYTHSANKDFGDGIVQRDIIDSLEALKSFPEVSQTEIAIVGHSFGGFSALAGLSFTPDLFKFGFAGAPPPDLGHAIQFVDSKDIRDSNGQRLTFFSNLAAAPDDKNALITLEQKSPLSHWRRVNKPLYIWAGLYDNRVDIKQVRQYASLASTVASTTLLVARQSGHSPKQGVAREAYMYLLETALAKHLGGKHEPEVSKTLVRYLKQALQIDANNVLALSSIN